MVPSLPRLSFSYFLYTVSLRKPALLAVSFVREGKGEEKTLVYFLHEANKREEKEGRTVILFTTTKLTKFTSSFLSFVADVAAGHESYYKKYIDVSTANFEKCTSALSKRQ